MMSVVLGARGGAVRLVAADLRDVAADRQLYLAAGGLVLLGLVVLVATIWWWRSTRPEPRALASLETMTSRRWRRADELERHELLVRARAARPPIGSVEVEPGSEESAEGVVHVLGVRPDDPEPAADPGPVSDARPAADPGPASDARPAADPDSGSEHRPALDAQPAPDPVRAVEKQRPELVDGPAPALAELSSVVDQVDIDGDPDARPTPALPELPPSVADGVLDWLVRSAPSAPADDGEALPGAGWQEFRPDPSRLDRSRDYRDDHG